MIVWHVPEDGRGQNRFGTRHVQALEDRGITVRKVPLGHLYALRALRERPDVVHFQFIDAFLIPHKWRPAFPLALVKGVLFLLQAMALKFAGVRLFWTVNNIGNHERRLRRTEWLFSYVFTWMADGLIFQGEHARAKGVKHYHLARAASRVHVVRHPNYVGAYADTQTRAEARAALGIDETAVMFLCLGQMRVYKKLELAIHSYCNTFPDSGETTLFIAGAAIDEDLVDALQTRAAHRSDITIHAGHVPDDNIQTYMRACDYALINYAITSSGAVVLAMSFARAVIAPKASGNPDFLNDDGAILFDPDAPHALDDALRQAVDQRSAAAAKGERNYARASEWTWDIAAEKLIALYGRSRSGAKKLN